MENSINENITNYIFTPDYQIKSNGKQYLNDILTEEHYERMFSGRHISILNKSRCGNGGTTGIINYTLNHNKGCLILVPNVSIVKSKEIEYKGNDDMCFIYGGSKSKDLTKKIIIATYDQYPIIVKDLKNFGYTSTDNVWDSTFWSGRTVIIDEFHKLVSDSNFRDICKDITMLIKHVSQGFILITATPHYGYIKMLRGEIKDRVIITYNVVYDDECEDNQRCSICEVDTKKIVDTIKRMFESDKNRQICVFYNNVKKVLSLANKFDKRYVEVLCSKKHSDEIGLYNDTFDEGKKLHFMTSAYYTGMDINVKVDQCLFIGDSREEYTCFSMNDIKQCRGRFRKNKPSFLMMYVNHNPIDLKQYECERQEKEGLVRGLSTMEDVELIPYKLDLLNKTDIVEKINYWTTPDKLCKEMNNYGFKTKVDNHKLDGCEDNKVSEVKNVSFGEYKKMICKGESVEHVNYKYDKLVREYYNEFGGEKTMKSSREEMIKWNKGRNMFKTINDMTLRERQLYFGLGNYTLVKGSYIMSCLKECGVDVSEINNVIDMNDWCKMILGINVCFYDDTQKEERNKTLGNGVYVVFMMHDFWTCKAYFSGDYYYRKNNNFSPEKYALHVQPTSHSLTIDTSRRIDQDGKKREYGKTIELTSLTSNIKSLSGTPLYDYVMEDKQTNLPKIKSLKSQNRQWTWLKTYNQSKISELFNPDIKGDYHFGLENLKAFNMFICDIDGGIKFSEFKKHYANLSFFAYPTLNNTTTDWTKFRVIFFNDTTLYLPDDYNSVKTLKILRSTICPYEDNQHMVYSYINQEDFKQGYYNKGDVLSISQDMVNKLVIFTSTKVDYKSLKSKFDKHVSSSKSTFDLDKCKDLFAKSFDLGDGGRHRTLFRIKQNIDTKSEDDFKTWLGDIYGDKYINMYNGHKRLK